MKRIIILIGLMLLLGACQNKVDIKQDCSSFHNWTNEDVELEHLATLLMYTVKGESIEPYLDNTNISDEVLEVYICYLGNILTEDG